MKEKKRFVFNEDSFIGLFAGMFAILLTYFIALVLDEVSEWYMGAWFVCSMSFFIYLYSISQRKAKEVRR